MHVVNKEALLGARYKIHPWDLKVPKVDRRFHGRLMERPVHLSLAYAAEVTERKEDVFALRYWKNEALYILVGDGLSEAYQGSPKQYPFRKQSLSLGQIVSHIASDVLTKVQDSDSPLESIIEKINSHYKQWASRNGVGENASERGGIVGVLMRIRGNRVELRQWGDCGYLVQDRPNKITHSKNQVAEHDLIFRDKFRDFLVQACKEHEIPGIDQLQASEAARVVEIKRRAWELYKPTFIEAKNRAANKEYGIINGLEEKGKAAVLLLLEAKDSSFHDLKQVSLFSDGAICFPGKGHERQALRQARKAANVISKQGVYEALMKWRAEDLHMNGRAEAMLASLSVEWDGHARKAK